MLMRYQPRCRLIACVSAMVLVSGCGGGGGGDAGTGGGGSGGGTPPPAQVTVSGTVTFDKPTIRPDNTLDLNQTERLPVRGATVEILRGSDGSPLATTVTDGSGSYSATVTNTPVRIRVKAQLLKTGTSGYDLEVRDNTAGNALYALDSAQVTPSGASLRIDLNAPTGWGGAGYTGQRAAAPFAILDMLWRARELLQQAEPGLVMPALDVFWAPGNNDADCEGRPNPVTGDLGTTFYVGGSGLAATAACPATPPGIYVLGDASGDASDDADEFDPSVIAHEFAHYFQDRLGRDDSMGGPHALDSRLEPAIAFSEGWGNAFQGFVLGSPLYRDTFRTGGTSAFFFDLENDSQPFTSLVETGFYSEASVQEIFWDIFDGAGELGDAVDLGYAAIHAVMRGAVVETPSLTSIFSFAEGLSVGYPSQATALRQRLLAEEINGTGDFAENQTLPSALDLVPVFRTLVPGVPVTVVSTDRYSDGDAFFASYNRLGGRRYFRIDLPDGGNLNLSAQGPVGSDPDFLLYRQGVLQCANFAAACSGLDDSVADGLETASYTGLAPGTYLLEVAECSNLGELCRPGPPLGETLITVRMDLP